MEKSESHKALANAAKLNLHFEQGVNEGESTNKATEPQAAESGTVETVPKPWEKTTRGRR